MRSHISNFAQFKIYVEELIPLDRDYLHILAGAAILVFYLLWKIIRRKQFRGYEIVGITLIVAVVAELFDIRDDLNEQSVPDIMENVKDVLLTAAVPGVVVLGRTMIQQTNRFRQKFGL